MRLARSNCTLASKSGFSWHNLTIVSHMASSKTSRARLQSNRPLRLKFHPKAHVEKMTKPVPNTRPPPATCRRNLICWTRRWACWTISSRNSPRPIRRLWMITTMRGRLWTLPPATPAPRRQRRHRQRPKRPSRKKFEPMPAAFGNGGRFFSNQKGQRMLCAGPFP